MLLFLFNFFFSFSYTADVRWLSKLNWFVQVCLVVSVVVQYITAKKKWIDAMSIFISFFIFVRLNIAQFRCNSKKLNGIDYESTLIYKPKQIGMNTHKFRCFYDTRKFRIRVSLKAYTRDKQHHTKKRTI